MCRMKWTDLIPKSRRIDEEEKLQKDHLIEMGRMEKGLNNLQVYLLQFLKHSILIGKPTGKTPLARPRHKWEDNIRMALKEMGIN